MVALVYCCRSPW